MPQLCNKSLFYSSNAPLPHCSIIKRQTHMIINTYNLAQGTVRTIWHTRSHTAHVKRALTRTRS